MLDQLYIAVTQQLGSCWFIENFNNKAILFHGCTNEVLGIGPFIMGPIGGLINCNLTVLNFQYINILYFA